MNASIRAVWSTKLLNKKFRIILKDDFVELYKLGETQSIIS